MLFNDSSDISGCKDTDLLPVFVFIFELCAASEYSMASSGSVPAEELGQSNNAIKGFFLFCFFQSTGISCYL